MRTIYLDNNATTRVAGEVVDAMRPYWTEQFGNPSSLHRMGQGARAAVEAARSRVASLIGAEPREVVFTSGGTESDNLAILGTLAAYPTRKHIVASAVEHLAVHALCDRLVASGYRVTRVGVDQDGQLDLAQFESSLDDDTAIAAVMHANNETGVVFPIDIVSRMTRERGIPLHVDAVQTAGRQPIDVKALGADTVSLSAHKMHGPKGAGALYVGPGVRLRAQLEGGHQERDLRPGTENVAAIIGFGAAADLAVDHLSKLDAIALLRDEFEARLIDRVHGVHVLGREARRTPNTSNAAFEGRQAEAILIGLSENGVCASSGSACSSGALEPSHVLEAMGIPRHIADGAVRFSLSRETTRDEIERALDILQDVVARLD